MTYSDKMVRQDMKRQQAEESIDVHGHDSMLAALFVHLVVVGDSPVCDIEYPGVGDGHTVGIAPDVFEDLTHTICRGLGMDDPVLVEALLAYSLRDGNAFCKRPNLGPGLIWLR